MEDSEFDLSERLIVGRQSREWIVGRHACPAFALYHIGLAGVTHASPEFCFIRQSPGISQLLVCFGGSGRVLIDGQWRLCETGDAYVTPAGVMHGYHALSGHGRWKVCWVMYEQSEDHAPPAGVTAPTLVQVDWRSLLASIECLYRETMGGADPAILQNWAYLVHAHTQRAIGPDKRLRQLWERIGSDPGYPWTVEELARIAAMSAEHLRRVCHTEVGCSPMRYVAELRMRTAATLLASESYSIGEVAEYVGYDNAFAFSTAFKRHAGIPPSQFRGRL